MKICMETCVEASRSRVKICAEIRVDIFNTEKQTIRFPRRFPRKFSRRPWSSSHRIFTHTFSRRFSHTGFHTSFRTGFHTQVFTQVFAYRFSRSCSHSGFRTDVQGPSDVNPTPFPERKQCGFWELRIWGNVQNKPKS